jgi:hypothetical protein
MSTIEHTGDIGPLISVSVMQLGGVPKPDPNRPSVHASAHVTDEVGPVRSSCEIWLRDCNFAELRALLQCMFGIPSMPIKRNVEGLWHGLYSHRDIGCTLEFAEEPNGTISIFILSA